MVYSAVTVIQLKILLKTVDDEADTDVQEWQASLPEDRLQYPADVFELANEFDLSPFRDILADSSPAVPERQGRRKEEVRDKGKQREEGNKDAATALPDDKEWGYSMFNFKM